ncbi:C-terminal binding protein [Arthrobacter mangrovi]|uniref:D-isomer specific 2-hydroxyacid dehydrogenase family protein n=1 Tax=Arthrobacter mangrovi TaxID=2966350 RepID=A0ABQ5MVA4_9MICC|nr:C-terminal binding protein [Arthrobacter mangrovi]GLB67883.1 D-isomer specific 2-hydroxyacid dehydrogenase family protein [Arthrobacter mangrovi]
MSTNIPSRDRPLAVYTDMDDTDFAPGVALLESAGFEVRYLDSQDPEVIARESAGAEALLAGYAQITAEVIAVLPHLRIIALMSVGFNNVDIEAARNRGIWVTNIPAAATEEVATHAFALALAVTRDMPFYAGQVRRGNWNVRNGILPPRLSERRLGLVGLGRIGRKLGTLAAATFGEVVGYDPMLPDTTETAADLRAAGIRRADLDEVLRTADVLSLHVPLTPETEHFIDADAIRRMPAGSYLVNVSRGQLLHVPAVVEALDSGHLAGVAVDVLDQEPPAADHPLVAHPRALVTPHVAYLSDRTDSEYVRQQAQNVVSWLRHGTPDTPLFPLESVQA